MSVLNNWVLGMLVLVVVDCSDCNVCLYVWLVEVVIVSFWMGIRLYVCEVYDVLLLWLLYDYLMLMIMFDVLKIVDVVVLFVRLRWLMLLLVMIVMIFVLFVVLIMIFELIVFFVIDVMVFVM